MAKNVLLGKDKERQVKAQQKIAKAKNKKKRRSPARFQGYLERTEKGHLAHRQRSRKFHAGSRGVYRVDGSADRPVRFWNAFLV